MQRGRLARPGFADDGQRAALLQLEADAVDRAHLADLPAEDHALGQLVRLDQVLSAQHHGRVEVVCCGGRFGGHAVDLRGAAAGDLVRADAGGPVVGPDLEQVRLGGAAVVDGKWAARGERAAGRQRGQRRRCAGYRHQACALRGVQAGHRAEKPCGVRHSAVTVQLLDRCDLDGSSGVHHQCPVRELGDHTEVVGDDQNACAGDVARGLEHVEDLRLHRDVQGGGRLVADQQIGIVGDRDGDDHTLSFAAGQFMGEGPGPPFRLGDTDELEQFGRAGTGGPAGGAALVDLDRFGDLVADGVDGRERRHRVLEHRADGLAADLRHPLVRQADELIAVQPHRSGHLGVFGQQADDGHRTGRLARTRFADERDDLSGIDVKVHPAHGADRIGVGREGDGQVAHLEQAHLRAFRRARLPGSSASRSPSPIRLAQKMISTSTPAGNRKSHGNVVADGVPPAMSVPSDTSGGWTPKPR